MADEHFFTVILTQGNALGCAAGLASLELFEKNRVLENVSACSQLVREKLSPLLQHPHVLEIRQQGLMIGIEMVRDRETQEPFDTRLRLGHPGDSGCTSSRRHYSSVGRCGCSDASPGDASGVSWSIV